MVEWTANKPLVPGRTPARANCCFPQVKLLRYREFSLVFRVHPHPPTPHTHTHHTHTTSSTHTHTHTHKTSVISSGNIELKKGTLKKSYEICKRTSFWKRGTQKRTPTFSKVVRFLPAYFFCTTLKEVRFLKKAYLFCTSFPKRYAFCMQKEVRFSKKYACVPRWEKIAFSSEKTKRYAFRPYLFLRTPWLPREYALWSKFRIRRIPRLWETSF